MKLDTHDAMVLEMGMNHFKEIELLTKIAKTKYSSNHKYRNITYRILGSRENILDSKIRNFKKDLKKEEL